MSMSDWSDDHQYDGDEMDMSQEHDFNEEDDVSMGFHEAQDDNITPRNFCLLPISDINPSVCLFIHLMCFICIDTWFLWCPLQNVSEWFMVIPRRYVDVSKPIMFNDLSTSKIMKEIS